MLKTFPAKVRKDGSLSLSKTARERLGLKPGDTVEVAVRKNSQPVQADANPLYNIIGIGSGGPADGAENHDVYLYGKKRK